MSTSEAPPSKTSKSASGSVRDSAKGSVKDKLVCDESNEYGAGAVPMEEMATSGTGHDPQRLPLPEETQPLQIMWRYVIVLSLVHLVAIAALVPGWFAYLFTWSGLIVGIAGHFVFGMLGITIGYHRLLTHRGFQCPKWMEHTLAILGMCNLQDSPARWVAIHRMHHQHSDHQPDPHSPLASFLWGHMGWVVCRHRDLDKTSHYERYVRDLLRDRFYLKLERKDGWFFVFLIHAIAIASIGGLLGLLISGGDWSVAGRYYLSWAVWGVAMRTVFVLHGTWSVNSLGHVFGYRNYETRDHSTNNWLVALISHGEGWHNNHHAAPRSARHGHKWYEFDMSWGVIRVWEMMGLITDVQRPTKASVAGK